MHQAKIEQAEDGRRARAGLLRDFETTTLTRENFCALKAIAPQALDALLATARREAEEQRLRQPPPQRPGPPPTQRQGLPSAHRQGMAPAAQRQERRPDNAPRAPRPGAGRPGGPRGAR